MRSPQLASRNNTGYAVYFITSAGRADEVWAPFQPLWLWKQQEYRWEKVLKNPSIRQTCASIWRTYSLLTFVIIINSEETVAFRTFFKKTHWKQESNRSYWEKFLRTFCFKCDFYNRLKSRINL